MRGEPLNRKEVWRLDEADRIADRVRSMPLNPGKEMVPASIEVLRPDLLGFDRDAHYFLDDVSDFYAKTPAGDVVGARIRTRLQAILKDVGDDPRRVYEHVSDVVDCMQLYRSRFPDNPGYLNHLDHLLVTPQFQHRLGEVRDMDALSGRVSFTHAQVETVFRLSPESSTVGDLSNFADEIEIRLGAIEGVAGIIQSDRDDSILVRVLAAHDEEVVMLEVREALSEVLSERSLAPVFRP
jgi:hypothetical protein